jgi:hypothetical protein
VPLPVHHRCRPPFIIRTGACDCSRCCAAAAHEPGCAALAVTAPQPSCTCPSEADYHRTDCPEYDGTTVEGSQFTAEQIRRCHEATEFDHECVVCVTLGQDDEQLGEAVPGTDY